MPKSRINQEGHVLIADDLAGACDCAVEFLEPGSSVRVWTGTGPLPAVGEPVQREAKGSIKLQALNTESRHEEPATAVTMARTAAIYARRTGARVILKKTDSAFRGNYVAELVATVNELSPAAVVVAPAIPDFGRTTIGGIQCIDGTPIADSFYAADPRSVVRVSRVAELLHNTGLELREVSLRELRARSVKTDLGDTPRVYIVDGETNEDLDLTVELFAPGEAGLASDDEAGPVLFVGGQGIAAAIARRGFAARQPYEQAALERDARAQGKPHGSAAPGAAMIVCGSLHPQSRSQLVQVLERTKMSAVVIGSRSDTDILGELRRLAETNGAAILTTRSDQRQIAGEIEERIAELSREMIKAIRIRSLFLTGGGTAFSVCRALGIRAVDLREKLADGTVIVQPTEPGLPQICVKGGSLGPVDVMELFFRRFAP